MYLFFNMIFFFRNILPKIYSIIRGPWKNLATVLEGCFCCIQHDFDHLPDVLQTQVGYTGGDIKNASYEMVCSGKTGHVEAVQVLYDSRKISYKNFWIFTSIILI